MPSGLTSFVVQRENATRPLEWWMINPMSFLAVLAFRLLFSIRFLAVLLLHFRLLLRWFWWAVLDVFRVQGVAVLDGVLRWV